MICKNCNANNADGAKFCVGCGMPLDGGAQPVNNNTQNYQAAPNYNAAAAVPTYNMTPAIIAIVVSVLCCGGPIGLIFSILSLVEGNKVKNFVAQGDMANANNSLATAKKWNKFAWIAIAVCAVLVVLYCIFVFGIAIISEM